jgi:soluble lytic murein transglycosylase
MSRYLFLFLLLLCGVLAGCDLPTPIDATAPLPDYSPTPEGTYTPTATLTPEPTATPTATPVPAERIEQGDLALFEGDYDLALAEYELARQVPEDADIQAAAITGIGRTNYLLGRTELAIQSLQEVIDYYPSDYHRSIAAYFSAQAHLAAGNPEGAAADFALYLELRPGVLDSYMNEEMADALLAAGNPTAAIQAYEAARAAPRLGGTLNLDIKIADAYVAAGDNNTALQKYLEVYDQAGDDYTRATMNQRAGQIYLALGNSEEAYHRYLDSVINFPKSYDSYTQLVELVNAGVAVDDLYRGIVDYYGSQYGLSVAALTRYIEQTPNHDGTPHYYIAWALFREGDYAGALNTWDEIIKDHSGDRYWATAWDEKAYIQWYYLEQPEEAAQTLLDFVQTAAELPEAPVYLYEAGRILERNDQLAEAALVWARLIDEYPNYERSQRALFLSGIQYYRLADFPRAQTTFERALLLATDPADQAAADLWIGKSRLAQNDPAGAASAWQTASGRDPTGYYSERAKELLAGVPPLTATPSLDLTVDLESERSAAETWFRQTFDFPQSLDLTDLGALAGDPRFQRGDAFWELGLYEEARAEFESLRQENASNALNSYRLLNHFLKIGLYRSAILTSRNILDLAGLDDATMSTAPVYFNHIRFGLYYRDRVLESANLEGLHPLILFSLIRQESYFEGFIKSEAGARGLMQLMPPTGQDMADKLGFPSFYSADDLYRPLVSLRLGTHYLAIWYIYFDGDMMSALAAYNGGWSFAEDWKNLSQNDPDLYLEVVRFEDVRFYITQISDFLHIYRSLYEVTP